MLNKLEKMFNYLNIKFDTKVWRNIYYAQPITHYIMLLFISLFV